MSRPERQVRGINLQFTIGALLTLSERAVLPRRSKKRKTRGEPHPGSRGKNHAKEISEAVNGVRRRRRGIRLHHRRGTHLRRRRGTRLRRRRTIRRTDG